ncbi:MAG TPA: tetratricopeptide repeat protein [Acetobacteraceae bacterium]
MPAEQYEPPYAEGAADDHVPASPDASSDASSDDFQNLVENAETAARDQDWAEAFQRWSLVSEHYPDDWRGYFGAALALRELGRTDEAADRLRQAIQVAPDALEPKTTLAHILAAQRDWPKLEECWETVRVQHPDFLVAYVGLAGALREQQRLDDALLVLQEAIERFPGEVSLHVELAFLAQQRNDWPAAARRWESLRERFADHAVGYIEGARALEQGGQPDEADDLLSEAASRFPDLPGPAIARAALAARRLEWENALHLWQAVQQQFPDAWQGHSGAAMALQALGRGDEMEPLLLEANRLAPDELVPMTTLAHLAGARRDWPGLHQRWNAVRETHAGFLPAYIGAAGALTEQGMFDDADELLEQAVARFPHEMAPLAEFARSAQRRANWSDAARRWLMLRERFPDDPLGYTEGARSLQEAGGSMDADALLAEAQARFPDLASPWMAYAESAMRQGDWAEAAERWSLVRDHFPDDWRGCFGAARALRELGRADEAEHLLREAMRLAPGALEPLTVLAHLAADREDWQALEWAWQQALTQHPGFVPAYTGLAGALSAQHRFDEAETVLQTGLDRDLDRGQMSAALERLAAAKSAVSAASS